MWFIAGCILFLVFIYLILDIKKPQGYPPGPNWLPLLGNVIEFLKVRTKLKYTHLVWDYWGKRYGPLAAIRLGFDKIVIVSDYKFAREVLLRDEFEGRPDGFLIRMRSFGKRLGVVFTDGDFGQEQRAFCIRNLKEFGFGRSLMEEKISEEISELIESLNEKCQEGPVDVYSLLNINVMNTLWTMIAGTRFSHRDEKMLTLLDYIHTSFRMQDMTGGILNQLPIIRFIGPGKRIYEHNLEIANNLTGFMRETVEEHKKTLSPNYTRDLVDAFLQEIEKANKSTENNFSEEQLLTTLLDLFMAGADTTINTITFVTQMLIKHPDVQKKVQQELDLVVGDNTQVTLKDRNRLNYLEAVIMEVQRFCNATPTSIPHRAKKCVKLNNCIIPKDTSLVVNLYSIHMNKEHWGDPDVFRPERFLDSNGVVKHDDWLMPFGLGRRRCLGEILARASVFKYSSALLLNFNITSPKGTDFEIEPHDGAILFPQKIPIILTPRKN